MSTGLERRAVLTGAEVESEHRRQTQLHSKHQELNVLANFRDDHLRQVDETLAARKQIFDEMQAVRSNTQDKLLSARSKGAQGTSVASQALARAGKHALDARTESERWQSRAAVEEARQRAIEQREKQVVAQKQEAARQRVRDAQQHAISQSATDRALVAEASSNYDQIRQRHAEHCNTQMTFAHRHAAVHAASASVARQDAAFHVRNAVNDAVRNHMAAVAEVKQSREDAANRLHVAQRELNTKRNECKDFLERQRVCEAQARKLASNLQEQQNTARMEKLGELDKELAFTDMQSKQKGDNFEQERRIAANRNDDWEVKANNAVDAARQHARHESEQAAQQLQAAKEQLAELHACCAAYLRELTDRWEEAKRQDAAKVKRATERTQSIHEYCANVQEACEQRIAKLLHSIRCHHEAKHNALGSRNLEIDELHKHRVQMHTAQATEWREKAEKQLHHVQVHVMDVQAMCDERVREEAKTAKEKVRLAQERLTEQQELAMRRVAEAEARRDTARRAHAAVFARCTGAADQSRRRGLFEIGDLLEHDEDPPRPSSCPVPEGGPDFEGDPEAEAAILKIQAIARGRATRQRLAAQGLRPQSRAEEDANLGTASTAAPASSQNVSSLSTSPPRTASRGSGRPKAAAG